MTKTNGELSHELILQIIKTRRAFRQSVQRQLKLNNVDMTFEMLQVMHRLWQQQGISQQQLAIQTSKDKACLTNLIKNLVKKGWVVRSENESDRRHKIINLTDKGEAMAGIVRPIMDGIYSESGSKMDNGQMLQCLGCLEKLGDIFNEI